MQLLPQLVSVGLVCLMFAGAGNAKPDPASHCMDNGEECGEFSPPCCNSHECEQSADGFHCQREAHVRNCVGEHKFCHGHTPNCCPGFYCISEGEDSPQTCQRR